MSVPFPITEQQVIIVANNEATINSTIKIAADLNWIVQNIILSGNDVIILFSRIIISP